MIDMDPRAALRLMPQPQPYQVLDTVLECLPGERILASRTFLPDEPFFAGHFPGNPIVPGVLQVEAIVQAAALLALHSGAVPADGTVTLLGLDRVRFRRSVVPGDVALVHVHVLDVRGPTWRLRGDVRVGEDRAAEAQVLISLGGGA